MISTGGMLVRFWGVRGSYPAPGAATVRYGGNTSCVEVSCGETRLVIDAGTGIRRLGRELGGSTQLHLLLSHTHWDHVQGLPFFKPMYRDGSHLTIYALERHRQSLREIISGLWAEALFPLRLGELAAQTEFVEVRADETFRIGGAIVRTARLNHPYIAIGYRVEHEGKAITYVSDTAPFRDLLLETEVVMDRPNLAVEMPPETRRQLASIEAGVVSLARETDLLVYDTQFTEQEYADRPHWGHSTPAVGLSVALAAKARRLMLFHHAPDRSDDAMDAILEETRKMAGGSVSVDAAYEGLEVTL